MTKTVEQREKDLKAGPTWDVASAWSKAIGGFEKELKAPIFLKSGNVAALAAQYDTLQSTVQQKPRQEDSSDGQF